MTFHPKVLIRALVSMIFIIGFATLDPSVCAAEAQSQTKTRKVKTSKETKLSDKVQKDVLGWIEKVKVFPGNLLLHAKLDTGADFCSLGTPDIQTFKKGGKRYARFLVRNRAGEERKIVAEIVRTTKIKRINGNSSKRVVVRLDVCIGSHHMEVDVNLVNRANFSYRMLIGRNFLAGNIVVDSSRTYVSSPKCKVLDQAEEDKKKAGQK